MLGHFLVILRGDNAGNGTVFTGRILGSIIIEQLGFKVVVQLEDIDHNRVHLYVRVFKAVLKLFVQSNIVVNF